MRKIASMDEYKSILKNNREKHRHVDTNSFLMKKDVEPMLEKKSLYVEEYPEGIVLFSDEKDFYKAYYHIGRECGFPSIRADKPVVIDELDKAGNRSDYIACNEKRMKAAGFTRYRRNLQYEKKLENGVPAPQGTPAPLRLFVLAGDKDGLTRNMWEQSVNLWDKNLELADIDASHRVMCDGTRILCIVTPDNRVVATEWFRNADGRSEGRHTVTDSRYRGKGLAKELLCTWCSITAGEGIKKALTWIAEDTEKSIRLHKSVGFSETDMVCVQYCKKFA